MGIYVTVRNQLDPSHAKIADDPAVSVHVVAPVKSSTVIEDDPLLTIKNHRPAENPGAGNVQVRPVPLKKTTLALLPLSDWLVV
jgi:hypothetical protein